MYKTFLYLILFLVGCTSTVKQPEPAPIDQVTYQQLTSKYISCSGKGSLSSSGTVFGKLSFDFISQNDSSFFKFKDPLGRKILLMWVTSSQISAWNIIDNNKYSYQEVIEFFPFLNFIHPMDITQFLWGIQPDIEKNIQKINSQNPTKLTLKFEWNDLNGNPSELSSIHFTDTVLNQSVKINIKERTPNQSKLDLSKIWKLINT